MGYTKMKKGGNSCKKEFPPLHVLMIISILTRKDTPVAMCVCVCVYTNLTHKFTRHFFEYRYMHDAADNGMLPEQIAIFPEMCCKSKYIVIQLLNSACKVSGF